MKRKLLALISAAVTAAVCTVPEPIALAADDNNFGDGITWRFDETDGTLTIEGTGATADSFRMERIETEAGEIYCSPYWVDLRTEIRHVVVGEGITELGFGAFCGLTELETVTLPDSLTTMQGYAFAYCAKLMRFAVPETAEDLIFNYNLWGCDTFFADDPFLLSADGTKFLYCGRNDMESIEIPEGVQIISAEAFSYDAKVLRSVTLPDSVTALRGAFHGCTALEEITLPDSVQSIGEMEFQGCTSLRRVTLSDSMTEIPRFAFYNCAALSEIHIPAAIETLGEQAFQGCTALLSNFLNPDGTVILDGKILLSVTSAAAVVTVPDTVRIIADNALPRYNRVVCMKIPASVISIGTEVVTDMLEIYGVQGSAAETFARQNSIPFYSLNAVTAQTGPDNSIIYGEDTWSIRNSAADFGSGYYMTDAARAALLPHMVSGEEWVDEAFSGACFGLTVTTILAKAGILSPQQIQSGAKTLTEITPTDDVRSVINFYHFTQRTKEMLALATDSKTDAQIMYQTIQAAKNVKNGGLPFLISLSLNIGGHAYVGYGQEDGIWEFEGKTYDGRILIWDPNFPTAPNENTYIYYDTATFAYCIPYYKSYVEPDSVGSLKRICHDTDILNMYAYPFETRAFMGDVDCDGDLTLKDAVLLAKVIGNVSGASLSAEGFANADLDGDGSILGGDLSVLLRMLAGAV